MLQVSETKTCRKCASPKPLSSFYRDSRRSDGRQSNCKLCNHATRRAWARANPDKVREQKKRDYQTNRSSFQERARRWYERHREKVLQRTSDYARKHKSNARDCHLKRTYGISLAEHQSMREAQGHVCAVCKDPARMSPNKDFAVDHCHSTGRVRGLLCHRCNQGIGLLADNPDILRAAIAYLETA
jgi:hypothetical protein